MNKELGQQRLLSVCGSRTMVGMLDTIKQELKKEPSRLRGQVVSSSLEKSSQRMPFAKAHALFYTGLKEVGGDESKIYVV